MTLVPVVDVDLSQQWHFEQVKVGKAVNTSHATTNAAWVLMVSQ